MILVREVLKIPNKEHDLGRRNIKTDVAQNVYDFKPEGSKKLERISTGYECKKIIRIEVVVAFQLGPQ